MRLLMKGCAPPSFFDGIEIYKRDPVREQIIQALDAMSPDKKSKVLDYIQTL